jgi:hypothetical protein
MVFVEAFSIELVFFLLPGIQSQTIATHTNASALGMISYYPLSRCPQNVIVLKRVPIVCVAYPIVDDFVRPKQPLLSRASNSTPANIDGFSAILHVTHITQ